MGAARTQLSRADLEAALALVRRVESVPDLASFRSEALASLRELVPCDVLGYNEIDAGRGSAVVGEDPPGSLSSTQIEAFRLHFDQHPAIAHIARTADPTPLRISDFVSRRQFHRLDIYDGVFRPSGLEHQIALTVETPAPLVIGISLNRVRGDFTERDRALLGLLRPHLSAARRNAELRQLHLAAQRLPEAGLGIALLSEAGPILAASRLAENLLASYFGGAGRPPYLPDDLARWVGDQRRRPEGDGLTPPNAPLSVEASRGRLVVRFLPGVASAEPDLLVLSESPPAIDASTLRELGLTGREAEVLTLAERGLRNRDIARELFVSPATVKKHLENSYRKLGVHSRTAALARARDTSGRRRAIR